MNIKLSDYHIPTASPPLLLARLASCLLHAFSVSARGISGESPRCPSVEACTATQDDRRTQLALWVGGRGTLHFAMGNERGKGVLLEGQEFPEGVWTHLAVTMEGRKVCALFVPSSIGWGDSHQYAHLAPTDTAARPLMSERLRAIL